MSSIQDSARPGHIVIPRESEAPEYHGVELDPSSGPIKRLRPPRGGRSQNEGKNRASARIELDYQMRLHLHGVGHLGEMRNARELRGHLRVVDLDIVRHVALAERGGL